MKSRPKNGLKCGKRRIEMIFNRRFRQLQILFVKQTTWVTVKEKGVCVCSIKKYKIQKNAKTFQNGFLISGQRPNPSLIPTGYKIRLQNKRHEKVQTKVILADETVRLLLN